MLNKRIAVDKLEGKIKRTIINTGNQNCKNELLKLSFSVFNFDKYLAEYTIKTIDAKVDVWKLTPIIGILIHLLALEPEIKVPWDKVYTSKSMTIGIIRIEIPLK